jgi:hypothetical protein
MKSLRDPKRKPMHPAAVLRQDVLPALGMSQTELARRLGVSRLSVSVRAAFNDLMTYFDEGAHEIRIEIASDAIEEFAGVQCFTLRLNGD